MNTPDAITIKANTERVKAAVAELNDAIRVAYTKGVEVRVDVLERQDMRGTFPVVSAKMSIPL